MEPITVLYAVIEGLIVASRTHREVMARVDDYAKQHGMTRQEVLELLRAEARRRGDAAIGETLRRLDALPDWAWATLSAPLGPLGMLVRPAVRLAVKRRGDAASD